MIGALLVLHVLVAVLVVVLAARLRRHVMLVAAVGPLATFVWASCAVGPALDGTVGREAWRWVPALGLDIDLSADAFAVLMALLIGGIGTLVCVYSVAYLGDREGVGRFAAALVLFAGAMLGVVVADNLFVLYVFWELTAVTSYLLIGFEDEKGSARAAALQALLVTGAGGLAMLAGFVVLGQAAGTYSLSGLLAAPPTGSALPIGVALVLVGAFTKSAQVPFHFWLPGAMAAPTPVSAYLHSATMVKAGVYLIARFAPAMAPLIVWWRPVTIGVGLAGLVLGGYRALRQTDLKLLLAYGTVSQLGLLVAVFGTGMPALAFAGMALLLAHGLFKAALFLVVGIIDHEAHTRDLRRLTGVGARLPVVAAVGIVSAASMAGLPPLLGFVAKEAVLEGYLAEMTTGAGRLALAVIVAGSALTFGYAARFAWGAFARKPETRGSLIDPTALHRPATLLMVPVIMLATLTTLFGLVPVLVTGLVAQASVAVGGTSGSLSLWHGWSGALALSALIVGGGAGVFALSRSTSWRRFAWSSPISADGAYRATIRGMLQAFDRIAGVVQNGSLPVYLSIIVATTVFVPGIALLAGDRPVGSAVFAESWLQAAVAALVVVLAVAITVIDRRFAAVLVVGAIGYLVAVLFIIQGAPDLALTQLLVETLAVLAFVLVLRHLPERWAIERPSVPQPLRVALAVSTGVFVAGFAYLAGSSRTLPAVSQDYLARSLPEAGGRNVVNVILVDFRGYDTLGEIAVLVVALLGVASLVSTVSRRGDRSGGGPSRYGSAPSDDPADDVLATEGAGDGR